MEKEHTQQNLNNFTEFDNKSWVTVPRYINNYLADNKITFQERLICLHLRTEADMYGYTTTNVQDIKLHFPSLKISTINKYLSNLKAVGLVSYANRKGKRGKFRLLHAHFLTPKGSTPLPQDMLFASSAEVEDIAVVSEYAQDIQLIDGNRMFEIRQEPLTAGKKQDMVRREIAPTYKEKENEKDKNTNTVLNNSYKCTNKVSVYRPQSYEEDKALEFARNIGEECFDFYLSIINRGKFLLLEKAIGEFKEDLEKGNQIQNKKKYFSKIYLRIEKEALGGKLKAK